MKKIRFVSDYRGVLTKERYYQAGDVVEITGAADLVAAGRAEFVDSIDPSSIPANHEPVEAVALGGLNVQQLKGMAKAAGIKGYGRMRRSTLLKKLKENDATT